TFMKRLMFLALVLAPACALDTETNTDDLNAIGQNGEGEPKAAGIHWAKGAKPGGGGGNSDPHLLYHGGPIAASGFHGEPIFWGASWSNPGFVGDKVTGLQTFFSGMGGTSYDGTNGEYNDSTGAFVGSGIQLGVTHTDLSSAPKSGSRTSPILKEVCAQI